MTVVVPTDGLEAIPQSYEKLVFERAFYAADNSRDKHWLHPYNYLTPRDAAFLLRGLDPRALDAAGEAEVERAEDLEQIFCGYNKQHPADRSWRDWHAVAKEIEADYDKRFDYFFEVAHPAIGTVAVESTQVVIESASNTTTTPRNVMKKKALIGEVLYEWPTVEADIREASRNGLKKEAHAGKHAEWDVDLARQWAKKNGKLKTAHAESHPHAHWPGGVTRHIFKD